VAGNTVSPTGVCIGETVSHVAHEIRRCEACGQRYTLRYGWPHPGFPGGSDLVMGVLVECPRAACRHANPTLKFVGALDVEVSAFPFPGRHAPRPQFHPNTLRRALQPAPPRAPGTRRPRAAEARRFAGPPRRGIIAAVRDMNKWLEAAAWAGAGAGFVWLGTQRSPRLWVAAAFVLGFAVTLRVAWRALWRPSPRFPMTPMVTYDDRGVAHRLPDGRVESIRWDELAEVAIVTTDEGPFVDDVHWRLEGDGNAACVVPSETAGMTDLLERLQQLPGFDNEAVIRAMTKTSNARFVVWRRPA
jgi:hypothetical protein